MAGTLLAAMIRIFQEDAIVRLRIFSFCSALFYIFLLSDGVFGQGVVVQIKVPKPGTPLVSTVDDDKIYAADQRH